MALVRWEPVRELTSLQNEMNRLFNTFFDTPTGGNGAAAARRWIPAMDLVETDDHFVLQGRPPRPHRGRRPHRASRTTSSRSRASARPSTRTSARATSASSARYGAFRRSLTLPEGVDAEAVSASFDHGVLEVRIPKPEERKPRRVAIQVGERPAADRGRRGRVAAQADRAPACGPALGAGPRSF